MVLIIDTTLISKMVSPMFIVFYIFGTFYLAHGESNYDQTSIFLKHFTRNQNIGLPIVRPKNILLPVPGLPRVRKFLFIPSLQIHKYGNVYKSDRNQDAHWNMFLENTLKMDRQEPTLAPAFTKHTTIPTINIAANTIPNNEVTTESSRISTSGVQEETDYSTTPTLETTTDVDYDVFNRMAVPPQVVASLLG